MTERVVSETKVFKVPSLMLILKWIVIFLVSAYVGVAALLYFLQRTIMYLPHPVRVTPAESEFSAEELTLTTPDGERLIAWHVAPREGAPVIVYFHGNGGNLGHRVPRFKRLVGEGFGLMALSYRGYGGSSGSPSEAGLRIDAVAAYEEAARRYGAARLVLWGESLGTSLALGVAAGREAKAVVLESPFLSTLAIAQRQYAIFPVSVLMKDTYRSDNLAPRVHAPVLILHGARDKTVPIGDGEQLFALFTGPKKFVRFPDGDHNHLDDHGASAAAIAFLRDLDGQK